MKWANPRICKHLARYLVLPLVLLAGRPSITTVTATGPAVTQSRPETTQSETADEAKRLLEDIDRLFTAGRYSEAIPLAERLLTIYEKQLGPDDPQVATLLNNTAVLHEKKGDYARAESLDQRALAIRERTFGPDHPDVAQSLNNLALLYEKKADYAKAELLFQRTLAILEKTQGPESPDIAYPLNNLGLLYKNKSEFAKAKALFQRALAIREKALGPEHPDVAVSLNNLAGVYDDTGEFYTAETLYKRSLAIWAKSVGPAHPDVASGLANLADLYSKMSEYAKAEPLYLRAVAILEKTLGPDHPSVATALASFALFHYDRGDYAQAEALYERALTIAEKALGPEHPDVASSLYGLAELHLRMGDYSRAEALAQRALALQEKTFGLDHPSGANSLNIIAELHYIRGDYVKAEALYQHILALREKAYGASHPGVAQSLSNLALIYDTRGDHAKAEALYQRAVAIFETAFGPDHPSVAASLNNLAEVYRATTEYTKAEALYKRALAILEKAFGADPLAVAAAANNLALLYHVTGDTKNADILFKRALEIRERAAGTDHPDVAQSLNNLGLLYYTGGEYGKAADLLQRALPIWERTLGLEHPNVARILGNLAAIELAKGNPAKAIVYLSRACAISERNIAVNAAAGSDRQKLLYLATLSDETDFALSLHLESARDDPAALELALTTILRRKGRSLDAMTDSIAALRRRLGPQDQPLLDQLADKRSRLATLTLGGPGKSEPARHRESIRGLEEQIERIETQISQRSAEFASQNRAVTIPSIQSAMPSGAALVELVRYHAIDFKGVKRLSQRYAAYVLGSSGEPSWVKLGEAEAIDRAVQSLRAALRDEKTTNVKQLARALDERVMQPVRKLLGERRTVLLSPDGELNLIPFAALVDEGGRYLVEQYSFIYLTSGRDLLRLQLKAQGAQGATVIGDPDFGPLAEADSERGLKITDTAGGTAPGGRVALDFSRVRFAPLPGTAGEALAMKSILRGATVLTGAEATETAVKHLSAPGILHIATHGFFLQDAVAPDEGSRGLFVGSGLGERGFGPRVLIESPLLRSGLALAGANLRRSGEEDGILTALEASLLNLWGTKLVVLSACDSGVGEVKTGEGVYGLRRALVLAGSQTQVMSLWPVNDAATRDLMIDYYKALQVGQGRGEALRQTQLRMLANPERHHPFFWAGFIQSGEWANLDGKR